MAWISRSLTGLLQEREERPEKEEGGSEFWDDPELFDTAQGVRGDLTELRKSLTQSLLGVASFLAPPPALREEGREISKVHDTVESPKGNSVEEEDEEISTKNASAGEKEKLTGMQSDFAELKGGFAKGLSRLSSVIRGDDSRRGEKTELEGDVCQDHGIAGMLKPLIDNVLSSDRVTSDGEDASRGMESSRMGISATLVDGVSKLASSLFSFDEDPDDVVRVPGLTDEVVAFARNISLHPETWLDFPLASDDEMQNDFEMNNSQMEHAYAVERAALRLAALKVEICPQHMSEGRFWKIYFVLLHPRLSQEDAELLSTPQVLEARKLLLEQLRQQPPQNPQGEAEIKPDDSLVVDKDAIPSTVKLAAPKFSEETEADDWLHEEATASNAGSSSNRENLASGKDEDEVSFSDLEDDHEEKIPQAKGQGWVELDNKTKSEDEEGVKHERMGSNDWLTVDKDSL